MKDDKTKETSSPRKAIPIPFENTKRNNKYLNIVRKRLQKMKMTESKFLYLYGTTYARFVDQFKVKEQPPFNLQLVRKLYLICNINIQDFLLNEIEEKAFFKSELRQAEKKNYLTHEYWNEIKDHLPSSKPNIRVKEIPLIPPNVQKKNRPLTKFYSTLADKYYGVAKFKIESHEVLFKGNNSYPSEFETYKNAQSKVIDSIEKKLEEASSPKVGHNNTRKDFSYKRVLYLSPSEGLHPIARTQDDMLKMMMIEASLDTLSHLARCFNRYSKFCEFYIAPLTSFRSHCIIDERILITEDYKNIMSNNQRYVIPNILFVDNVEVKSEIKKLKRTFDLELNRNDLYKLEEIDFLRYLRKAEEYLQQEMDSRKSVIEIIVNNVNLFSNSGDPYKHENMLQLKNREKNIHEFMLNQFVDIRNKIKEVSNELLPSFGPDAINN